MSDSKETTGRIDRNNNRDTEEKVYLIGRQSTATGRKSNCFFSLSPEDVANLLKNLEID